MKENKDNANTDNKDYTKKLLGSECFIESISYRADGGGDSLNDEILDVVSKKGTELNLIKELEEEHNFKDNFYDALLPATNLENGWYNNEGGTMSLKFDFEREVLTYSGEEYYTEFKDLPELDETLTIKEVEDRFEDDNNFKAFIKKLKENNIKNIDISFEGNDCKKSTDIDKVNGKNISFKDEINKILEDELEFAFCFAEEIEECWDAERGGHGRIHLFLEDDKVSVSVEMFLEEEKGDVTGEEIIFKDILNEDEYSPMHDMIEVVKDMNNVIAEQVENEKLNDIVDKSDSKTSAMKI